MAKHHVGRSLDQAISALALEKIASKTPKEFVEELKRQGIGSLEDLATKTIETAQAASQRGGIAFDGEEFGICYKFTSYRPVVGVGAIEQVITVIEETGAIR